MQTLEEFEALKVLSGQIRRVYIVESYFLTVAEIENGSGNGIRNMIQQVEVPVAETYPQDILVNIKISDHIVG